MYLYLENNIILNLEDIIIILDYEEIKNNNEKFYKNQKKNKEIIILEEIYKKSVIITNNKIYISKYGVQTLFARGKEFFNVVGGNKIEQ